MKIDKKIIVFKLFYAILLIGHLFLLFFYGISWFFSTILFYSGFCVLIIYLLKTIRKKVTVTEKKEILFRNAKYYIIASFLFVIFIDFGLRLFVPELKSYSERNTLWFYKSYFSDGNYYFRNVDNPFNLQPPNTSKFFKSVDFNYMHFYNEYGIRERKNLQKLIKDKIVIITIGDSFVEGVGTHQDSTWQRFLELQLNVNESRFLVINAGMAGSDPVHSLKYLDYLLSFVSPKYVIMCIGSNDFMDVVQRGGNENYESRNRFFQEQAIENYFYSWSFIFRLTTKAFYSHPEAFISKSEYPEKMRVASNIMSNVVKDFVCVSKEKGFVPILLLYADYHESVNLSYNIPEVDEFSLIMKKSRDLTVIDMLDYYENLGVKDREANFRVYYWPNDGHNTIKGYKLWADMVYQESKRVIYH